MENRERGHRGGRRNYNPLPSTFDQQAFIEVIGTAIATATIAQASVVVATIAQASATVSQGGTSNLQKFKAHHPPTFRGRGDPMVADH